MPAPIWQILPILVFLAGVAQLVLAWLALPLPILFHPPFLRGVVWPLLGMDGSTGAGGT